MPRPLPRTRWRGALLLLLAAACSDEPGATAGPVAVELQLARDLAAARFDDNDLAGAQALLQPLIANDDARGEDLLRAAIVALAQRDRESARALLERAKAKSPDDPRLWFNLARLARAEERLDEAATHLKRALEFAPGDLFTQLARAITLHDVESPEAEAALRVILAKGVEHGGSVYVAALYRLSRLQVEAGRMEEARASMDAFQRLLDQGITSPDATQVERGRFGALLPPPPQTAASAAPQPPTTPLAPARALFEGAGEVGVQPFTLVDDKTRMRGPLPEMLPDPAKLETFGAPELLAWGASGVTWGSRWPDGHWVIAPRFEPAASAVATLDWDKDGDCDYVAAQGRELRAYESGLLQESGIVPAKFAPIALPGEARAIVAVDFDHDGDLDLFLAGEFGVLLLRDDGLATGGKWSAAADAGVAVDGACSWAAIEDLDGDADVDLICGSATKTWAFDNLRAGKFRRVDDLLPADWAGATAPLFADLDSDGRPDVARDGRVASFGPDFRFRPFAPAGGATAAPAGSVRWHAFGDVDLDGRVDAVGTRDGARTIDFALGSATPTWIGPRVPAEGDDASGADATAVIDLDGDAAPDLLLAPRGTAGASLQPLPRTSHRALRLALIGVKDNRRGVGAVVELRAQELYRRLFWDGEPQLLGLGAHDRADFIRVTWPNGVVQTVVDAKAGGAVLIEQKEGLVGSCPFLYAWNGTRYDYVTDVLGITPLGLPMAPGMLVPPDHDEYVLIRGEQLAARDGFLDLQITEELREVTYLDRLRLDVVDHPAGSEVFPNERFTFPPFPEPKSHAVVAPHGPKSARDGDGRDWTHALAAIDGDLAIPFAPYRPAEAGESHSPTWGGQFQGLAPRHFLELEFDAREVADAAALRLVMTGWFFWTDASVNVAAARTPSIRFEPPTLQVPDGTGGWRDAGPPIGFPAGKQKTMVVDVSALLRRDDPRVRLVSTLRLYWDSIRLATDDGTTELRTTSLEPSGAQLWERGFSLPIELHGDQKLEWFDWERLAEPRWAQHPGSYTRLGETLPLVTAIDDRFVVMGSGDALHVRFSAEGLPPLPPGWRRDYLLFLDGWAKDRDPNSIEALHVEPLPFHGMNGYPYPEGQSFPDDEAHRQWRQEWLTRPARSAIPRLAPRAPFGSLETNGAPP